MTQIETPLVMNGIGYGVRIMWVAATATTTSSGNNSIQQEILSFVFAKLAKQSETVLYWVFLMRVGHSSHSYFFAGWRNHSHNLLFTTTTTSVLWLFKRVFIVRTQKNNLRVPRTSFPSLFSCNLCTSLTVFDISHFFPPRPFLQTTWPRLFFLKKKAKPTLWDLLR